MWAHRRYSDVKIRNATSEQANEILRGFATIPKNATNVNVEYTPFASATIECELSENLTRQWCKKNDWQITNDEPKSGYFEFSAQVPTGFRGGRWKNGRVLFIVH